MTASRTKPAVLVLTALVAGLLAVLAPVATPSASAQGETYPAPTSGSWSVNGAGWGHGIGMSQWGSQGAAVQGVGHRDILSFYYPGSVFGFVGNNHIRVQLTKHAGNAIVFGRVNGETLTARDAASGGIINLPPAPMYIVTVDASGMGLGQWTGSGWAPIPFGGASVVTGPLEMIGPSGTWVYDKSLNGTGTQYAGALRAVRTSDTAIQGVNVLLMDDYLKGVVPRESPSSWHAEALRAQAIAARSYALSVSRSGGGWDLCDTTQCQVYGGRASVANGTVSQLNPASTNAAVDATSGVVVAYENAPAFTQFSSSNGGYSVAGSRPYLVAKADPYTGTAPNDPVSRWSADLPVSRVQAECPSGGALQSMTIESRDGRGPFGGRITGLRVNCSSGNRLVTSSSALAFGMRHRMWQPTAPAAPAGANPRGNVERLEAVGSTVAISGWAFDPDTTDPIEIHVYIDGGGHNIGPANLPRPDVAKAFSGIGEAHGFSTTLSIGSATRRVCVYAINAGAGAHTLLTCKDVTGGSPVPRGNAEVVGPGGRPASIRVAGWALDPDSTGAIDIHAYVDGGGHNLGPANDPRPDVGRSFPGYGNDHGFDATINAAPGVHEVCLYAINVGPGTHGHLGCRQVTVNGDPIGNVETLTGGTGTIQLAGWAFDPGTASPIEVHVYIGSGGINLGPTSVQRADVAGAFPGYGDRQGFAHTFNVSRGSHHVCVYAINTGFGANRQLACRTVTVA